MSDIILPFNATDASIWCFIGIKISYIFSYIWATFTAVTAACIFNSQ
jgi:hypothetical protein